MSLCIVSLYIIILEMSLSDLGNSTMDGLTDGMTVDDGTYTVTTTCGGLNEYDGRLGLRISAIFVIGFGSMLGKFA